MHEYRQWTDDNGEVRREQNKHFTDSMNEEGYRFPSHKAGARMFEGVAFPVGMNVSDIGRMAILSKVMVGATNMLGYRSGQNIYAYTAVEIGELVDLRRTQALAFVNRMIRLHLMQKIATTSGPQYYVNPAYFMASGHRLSLDLFLLFRKELTPIVPSFAKVEFSRMAREKQTRTPITVTEAEEILNGG